MPIWATVALLGVVSAVGGYLIRYLNQSNRVLGRIEQGFTDHSRRLDRLEDWTTDRDAELVAYRNGYSQRARR